MSKLKTYAVVGYITCKKHYRVMVDAFNEKQAQEQGFAAFKEMFIEDWADLDVTLGGDVNAIRIGEWKDGEKDV